MTWLFFIFLGGVSGVFATLVTACLPSAIERDGVTTPVAPTPGARCTHCDRVLTSLERGVSVRLLRLAPSCFHCGERLATLLPRVTASCVLAAVVARFALGPTLAAVAAWVLSVSLVTASAIDLRHRLLPDMITLPLLWAGLIVNLSGMFATLPSAVVGAIAGYLVLWMLYWLVKLLRGIEGMGYGDFKLLAALGAWLGCASLPWIVVISSVTGAVVGIALIATGRNRVGTPLAFGPFLSLAGMAVLYSRCVLQ
ncbi:prepilin peptidase [Burkholderia orbicola]|uniref:A24 family peptidase n=1 Tax=Burkholderia orbicola TaxID=2978683 RepID=A0ABT8P3H8_9BURK|nr:A24 family peptidase [Burkholderia orbicola]MDN7528233.1 A24 family peptidase [Burkholderia orbicola]